MISNQQLDSTTSNSGGRDSPGTATSTAKSSRRDSLTDKVVIPTQSQLQQKQQSTQMQVPKATAFEIPANNTNRRLVLHNWKQFVDIMKFIFVFNSNDNEFYTEIKIIFSKTKKK